MENYFTDLFEKLTFFDSEFLALDYIEENLISDGKLSLAFANAHAFNLCARNVIFHSDLLQHGVVLRDGVGVEFLCKTRGVSPGYNLNGTDFIPKVLERLSSGKKIAVFGTELSYINSSRDIIESYGGKVTIVADGFQSVEHYLKLASDNDIDIFILAMGMPKQESVSLQLLEQVDSGLIICGGAIIDFLGGKVVRAPNLFIKYKLEWVYRLLKEPKRMFKRYVFGNVLFLYRCFYFRR